VAFVEFLVVVVPLWTFGLCICQLALIAQASLIVKHSANAAARAAAVVLPDDPLEYGGEPEMSIGRNQVGADELFDVLGTESEPFLDGLTDSLSGRVIGNVGRSRLNTIRLAANVPLMPLAPIKVGNDSKPTLKKALGGAKSLLTSTYYQPFAVAVTFPDETGEIAQGPEITVRVSYAYQCSVPLARRILCESFDDLDGPKEWRQAFFAIAQRFVGGRFRRLQHDATLLIHDAPYNYRPRGS
jgi:hypothetical protein